MDTMLDDVRIVGTIAGFVPDGERVRRALEETRPARVAFGIPPEDLEGLARLHDAPPEELPDLDPQTERLFEHLQFFGDTRIPSPDLETAYAWALAQDATMEPLDLDDEQHSHLYVKTVGFRHAVRSGFVLKKILKLPFTGYDDPYELVKAWDAYQNRLRPLQDVEAAREAHMAERLRALAGSGPVVAVVPVARFGGIVRAYRSMA